MHWGVPGQFSAPCCASTSSANCPRRSRAARPCAIAIWSYTRRPRSWSGADFGASPLWDIRRPVADRRPVPENAEALSRQRRERRQGVVLGFRRRFRGTAGSADCWRASPTPPANRRPRTKRPPSRSRPRVRTLRRTTNNAGSPRRRGSTTMVIFNLAQLEKLAPGMADVYRSAFGAQAPTRRSPNTRSTPRRCGFAISSRKSSKRLEGFALRSKTSTIPSRGCSRSGRAASARPRRRSPTPTTPRSSATTSTAAALAMTRRATASSTADAACCRSRQGGLPALRQGDRRRSRRQSRSGDGFPVLPRDRRRRIRRQRLQGQILQRMGRPRQHRGDHARGERRPHQLKARRSRARRVQGYLDARSGHGRARRGCPAVIRRRHCDESGGDGRRLQRWSGAALRPACKSSLCDVRG